jgi:hypothetical protein
MTHFWKDYAFLDFDEAQQVVESEGFILAAIHRALVDNNWMAVAYDKRGRMTSARGRNPHEAVCRLAWELRVRAEGKEASTGRK